MASRYDNQSSTGGFNYLPETEENGPLAKFELGDVVHKTVRIMTCIYKGSQGFSVYEVEENDRRFVISGDFPYNLSLNAFYSIAGEVSLDKKGKRQLKVRECESALPTDKEGIITVLRTLHGLDTQAHKLYAVVGADVLELLKNDPKKVASMVKGVGIKRAKAWQAELLSRGENDKELRKLYDLGLTPKQATRLVSEYGLTVCDEVARNPYFLMGKVRGYSFKKCDTIALDAGRDIRHPERIREGLLYVLNTVEERGHCSYPKDVFLQAAHALLDVTLNQRAASQLLRSAREGGTVSIRFGQRTYIIAADDLRAELDEWHKEWHKRGDKFAYVVDRVDDKLIDLALGELSGGGKIVVEDIEDKSFVTPGFMWAAESEIAAACRDIRCNERNPFKERQTVIDAVLRDMNVVLEAKQMEAVQRICEAEGGIFILNGSAGCGKTFTLNIIMRVLRDLYKRERDYPLTPGILAPTGKASKVAAKSTNLNAQTIHRALGLISSSGGPMSGGMIPNNCVVVDEFSMVDTILCSQLMRGIPKTSKVIMLGDTEQLPSIRAGRVLKDMIESGVIPVITLDVVKRQGANSGILVNAGHIIGGESIGSVIVNEGGTNGNAYVRYEDDEYKVQRQVLQMAKNCGLGAFQSGDVQVLCPLKSGPTGVNELNYRLQQILNPRVEGKEIVVEKTFFTDRQGRNIAVDKVFRVGDCVIHTKNNYEQPWYNKHPVNGFIETSKSGVVNGDTGVIDSIVVFKSANNYTHRVIYVRYDDHYIAYDNDYEELSLAYALTIHKSQGSQWPTVICPIVQPTMLLNRKLVYTMYTRAQETNVLFGRRDLIDRAIQNNKEDLRITLLKQRLQQKK